MGLFDHFVSPAGLVPAGPYQAPDPDTPVTAHVFLADKIDPATQELESVLAGRHPLDAWVGTQLSIWRSSGAAVQDEGQSFAEIRKVTADVAKRIEFEIRRVLAPAVDRKALEIVTIQVVSEDALDAEDMAASYVEYRNLLLPKPPKSTQKIRIPEV